MFPETEEGQKQANTIWDGVAAGKKWSGVVEKITRLGDSYFVNLMAIPIMRENDGLISVIFFELDMTNDIEIRDKLQKIAFIDFEKGLMIRHHMETTIDELIKKQSSFYVRLFNN